MQKVFRQRDLGFIGVLASIRLNQAGDTQLRAINSRFKPGLLADDSPFRITLASTNRIVAEVNESHLARISTQEFTYLGRIEGDYPRKSFPTEVELTLKNGAQVMLVKNDMRRRWVNGTIGKIVELAEDHISVEVEEDDAHLVYDIPLTTWEVRKHTLDHENQSIKTNIVASFTQYPLKLA